MCLFCWYGELFAFVKNGLFKHLVKITHRPDGVNTTDRPSVGNDEGEHNNTASRRRLRDVFDKSKDDKEGQGLWPWWKKAFNVFVDQSSTTPTAGVELDQTDYLLEPSIVGGIPDKLSDKKGVFSGTILGKALNITTQDRALIIGPPRTGKTAFLVAQLLIWAESKRSFICLDMKPEIWGITKEALIKQGYDVFAYNPTSGGGDRRVSY